MEGEEIKEITKYIFLDSQPRKADLAIVFGNRHQETLKKVFQLYQKGLVSKILLSGGINKITGQNEAEQMANDLVAKGVKKEDLILENKSTNSLENVLFSKKKIEQEIGFSKIKKIIAVVKHYHSRRTLMTFKKYFPKTVELLPVTYNIYGFDRDNWYKSEVGRKKVLEEWEKIPIYLAKGDIEEL